MDRAEVTGGSDIQGSGLDTATNTVAVLLHMAAVVVGTGFVDMVAAVASVEFVHTEVEK